jgi:hypothetical protein
MLEVWPKGGQIGAPNENSNPLPNCTNWHLDCELADTRDSPWLGLHTRRGWPSRCFLCRGELTNQRNSQMNEQELAERIIAEAKRWTESQFTLQAKDSLKDSVNLTEAVARLKLIDHIKQTLKEMREIA